MTQNTCILTVKCSKYHHFVSNKLGISFNRRKVFEYDMIEVSSSEGCVLG